MTERQPLIIDTDPGQDDAVAILLALASPEIDLLGITTVAGNVPLDLTEVNARKICDLAGRQDVPVFAGLSRPLVRSLVTAEHVHGRTGLDGLTCRRRKHRRSSVPSISSLRRSEGTLRKRHHCADRTIEQYCHGTPART